MNAETSDLKDIGRVVFKDGAPTFLPGEQITRVVYALTSLALTPVIAHVGVEAVFNSKGHRLWPGF